MDLSDENVEKALVMAARMQLAKQRQQLMASMVLMGINRIVITDGKISAKIMYDFTSKDTMSKRRTAQAYDYARDLPTAHYRRPMSGEGTYDSGSKYARQIRQVTKATTARTTTPRENTSTRTSR